MSKSSRTATTIRKYANIVLPAWYALAAYRVMKAGGAFSKESFSNNFAEWRLSVIKSEKEKNNKK